MTCTNMCAGVPCYLSTMEVESGRSWGQDQSGIHSETLSQKNKTKTNELYLEILPYVLLLIAYQYEYTITNINTNIIINSILIVISVYNSYIYYFIYICIYIKNEFKG
jgi:hypothetical protein